MDLFQEYMPHGHCYAWTPEILVPLVASDLLIGLAYLAIPVAILRTMRLMQESSLSVPYCLFGAFILLCGLGHLLDIWNVWHGHYGAAVVIRGVTALVSVATTIYVAAYLPREFHARMVAWSRRVDEEKAEFERSYRAARSKLDRYADR